MSSEATSFVLGSRTLSPGLHGRAGALGVPWIPSLEPESDAFVRGLNAANAVAFGGMGMPPWVQVDCATLPTVFCGHARPWGALPDALRASLVAADRRHHPEAAPLAPAADQPMPVSGFAAARTEAADTIVAFSLFSVLPRAGLGLRAKALGLRLHQAHHQVGVTQYNNAALRIHAAFGPLEILAPRVPGHVHAEGSLVYRVAVPDDAVLDAMARTGRPPSSAPPPDLVRVPVDGDTGRRVATLIEAHGRVAIVAPAHERSPAGKALVLRIG